MPRIDGSKTTFACNHVGDHGPLPPKDLIPGTFWPPATLPNMKCFRCSCRDESREIKALLVNHRTVIKAAQHHDKDNDVNLNYLGATPHERLQYQRALKENKMERDDWRKDYLRELCDRELAWSSTWGRYSRGLADDFREAKLKAIEEVREGTKISE